MPVNCTRKKCTAAGACEPWVGCILSNNCPYGPPAVQGVVLRPSAVPASAALECKPQPPSPPTPQVFMGPKTPPPKPPNGPTLCAPPSHHPPAVQAIVLRPSAASLSAVMGSEPQCPKIASRPGYLGLAGYLPPSRSSGALDGSLHLQLTAQGYEPHFGCVIDVPAHLGNISAQHQGEGGETDRQVNNRCWYQTSDCQ